MISLEPIDRAAASELIDFGTAGVSRAIADDQLDGAVAIHNILARHGAAYLADEVGMGKTYVALGVVALIRAMHPGLRVLYISPRANIQRKWYERELPNFVARAWKHRDQRVRAIDDQPAAPFTACDRLIDWVRDVTRNPDRDVFLRMSSFSIALRDPSQSDRLDWYALRDQLMSAAPFVGASEIDARTQDKETFKESYARALNRLIPKYDLVVVDEAHHLKHGPSSHSTRNRLLATVLGGVLENPRVDGELKRRFDRVLFLSATPLETDFAELGNQLRIFDFESLARPLYNEHPEGDEGKQAYAASFVVRRLATVRAGERILTKHEYRREWRAGGVDQHDEALAVPSLKEKLIVALMQKKVTELVKRKFGAQFQIGMLASFESFAESASSFDDADQTDDEEEREGIDSRIVTSIARSYAREFKHSLPHPKMDSVADELAGAMLAGEKSLVFVRRVRSVDELGERLCCKYNDWLRDANKRESPLLPSHLHDEWDELWDDYKAQREEHFARRRLFDAQKPANDSVPEGVDETIENSTAVPRTTRDADTGGYDTFFSWFFRGEPKPNAEVLSGAAFRRNRLDSEGAALNLLFEENYVSEMLGDPPDVLASLARELGYSVEQTVVELNARAKPILERVKSRHRSHAYHAFQQAALWLLKDRPRHADAAGTVLAEWYPTAKGEPAEGRVTYDASKLLNTATFFTVLRRRTVLRQRIWPEEQTSSEYRERFRRREHRRLLMSSVIRLGHPLIDLWAIGVRGMRSLRLTRSRGRVDGDSIEDFSTAFLDLLERQLSSPGLTSARELVRLAGAFDVIVQTNFAKAMQCPLYELPARLARVLGRQAPIAGLTGTHRSETAIPQFRMPGYPLVVVATDVLQEGEDLHTFCSRVVHYGLPWTPSATEQRTGRVDRIGSLVQRGIESAARPPSPEERLQIYYPHLSDTVERLQAIRVFERLNKFVRLTHHGFGKEALERKVDTDDAFARPVNVPEPITIALSTAFAVRDEDLRGRMHADLSDVEVTRRTVLLFTEHMQHVEATFNVEWLGHGHDAVRVGVVRVDRGEIVSKGQDAGASVHIELRLRADARGHGTTLHITCPIAEGSSSEWCRRVASFQDQCTDAKITEVDEERESLYSAEVQVRFHPEEADIEETIDAIRRAATVAEHVERKVFAEAALEVVRFKSRVKRNASSQ